MKHFILFISVIALISCGGKSGRKAELSNIQNLERQRDTLSMMDNAFGNTLAIAYIDYAEKYKNDTLTPEFIFNAANIFRSMNKGEAAMKYLKVLETDYPDFDQAAMVIFFQAIVYEDLFKDYEQAAMAYKKFIEENPDHGFAADAKVLLQNIGKSPEELIKSFEEQNVDNAEVKEEV